MSKEIFLEKVVQKYGTWKREAAQFGNSSYGDIASDLCYSNSHFTKLMSGSASDAMYMRAIKNINQLIGTDNIKEELQQIKESKPEEVEKNFSLAKLLAFMIPALIGGYLLGSMIKPSSTRNADKAEVETIPHAEHPLARYFDSDKLKNVRSPYISNQEVHDFCPCSAFEGTWSLDKEYKMPLPSNKPGLYYVAKSADVRMKCLKGKSTNPKGTSLLGLENIHNEIWLDKSRMPFTPHYFDPNKKEYTESFKNLEFESNTDFVKIADVYSCFYDEFVITNENIHRIGEPCGRYANVLSEEIAAEFQIDVDQILNDVIGDMTSVSCQSAVNHYCNPNDLVQGESVINFSCKFSIQSENLGFGGGYPYVKGYKLIEQNYYSNLLCECN